MKRRFGGAVVLLALVVAAVSPAGAAPNEDGQPAGAPARYAAAPQGWMTSAAADRVHDIAQIGDTVYVAGTFSGIRPTPTGTVTARAWLAAFDAVTGAPRATFAPVLNGAVYTLEPSPDGTRLYIGGDFTSVNGAARSRLVALNPATGAALPGLVPNVGGGSVRSMVLRGTTLYLGGNFATVAGQARTRLAAVNVTTATPLATWQPTAASDSVLALEMAPDGSRLYVGGRFSSISGGVGTANLAAVDPANGAVQTAFTAQPGREVFDVLADGRGLVWTALGGVLGRADVYRAADGSLLTRHETAGDVEAVEEIGGLIYFGGHDIGLSELEHVGVVDPAAPSILETAPFDEPSTGGDGVWALHSTGHDLWIGGNVGNPWFGFTRHPAAASPTPRTDLVPVLSPWRYLDQSAAPGGWTAPAFADGTWAQGSTEMGFGDAGEATVLASGRTSYYFRRSFTVTGATGLEDLRVDLLVDDGAAVYVNGTEVVRTNLPAGTLSDTTRAVVGLSGNAEDTFRSFAVPASALVEGVNTIAVEVHQNAAASSDLSFDARLSAVRSGNPPPPPPVPVTVVERGARWRYRDGGSEPPADWAAVGFDAGNWSEGPAILGREEGGEATLLVSTTGARWFRRSFAIPDADAVTALRLDLVADDGAVAYVNGTEVVRDNVGPGALTATTPAASFRTGTAERAVRSFVVPPSVLRDGANVLAVRVHQASGSTDTSFDAALVATGAVLDTTPPSVPTGLTSPARTASSVDLAWAAATDDVAVDHYDVFVAGARVGSSLTPSFRVTGLAAARTYAVAVAAVDAAGNTSARTPDLLVTTDAAAPPPPAVVQLVRRGAVWRYQDSGFVPGADWTGLTYDDSTWPQGPAELGREDGGEATVVGPGTGVRWFRRHFPVTGAAGITGLAVDLVADDGAVVYINGAEVVRDNIPAGTVTESTPSSTYRTGTSEPTVRTFTVPPGVLREGDNVVAVSVHQGAGSTDVSFDLRLRTT